jgi:antitoxin VapB
MVEHYGRKVENVGASVKHSASLSLKNEETVRLARELAQRTGESLTLAVTIAIKERLERETGKHQPSGIFEKLVRISKQTAPLMNDGRSTKELFDELYDAETGLPK